MSHDPSSASSNGLGTAGTSPPSGSSPPQGQRKVPHSDVNSAQNLDSNANSRSDAGSEAKVNNEETIAQLPDGERGNEEELQDNFR